MDKIPVNIISGFLGSGKTTAIINLLGQKPAEEHWAVIINEFGKISIDSQTIRSITSDTGTVFDISGGCICCSAKGYFQENLQEITGSGKYSRIIIEPSGLGGIDMVSEIVHESNNLRLMPVICLVDISCIEIPRLHLLPVYRAQITKADILAFTKCDLLEDATTQVRLVEKFKLLFPDKKNCLILSDTNLQLLFSVPYCQSDENKYTYRLITDEIQQLTDDNFYQKNYRFDKSTIFDESLLIRFFNDHPFVIRAKGHLQTDKGWKLLNFTLSGGKFDPCEEKEKNELIIISEKQSFDLMATLDDKINATIQY